MFNELEFLAEIEEILKGKDWTQEQLLELCRTIPDSDFARIKTEILKLISVHIGQKLGFETKQSQYLN